MFNTKIEGENIKKISLEQKKDIVKYYKQSPKTIEEVSEHFNLSAPTIIKILNQFRVKRYSKVQLFSPELNEHYFNKIDNEYKAYFLGMIISDGCIYTEGNKQNLLALTLQNQDKYILEVFKTQLKSNKNITFDGRGCCGLQILSNILVKDLKQYGLCSNKSLKTIFPKNLPKEMYPHLIRGLIDGDGSISFYARQNRKSHTKAIRMCQGNKQFLIDFVQFLHKEIGTNLISIYQEKENLWSIRYSNNNDMKKIISYLYSDCQIFLTRKKELCDKILKEISNDDNTEITLLVTQ